MSAESFISSKLRFQGKIPVWATAISFVIIIIALSVAGGFRKEIRKGLSAALGDITISSVNSGPNGESDSIPCMPAYYDKLLKTPGVDGIKPAIYRTGVIKGSEDIFGVLFKGCGDGELETLSADIPEKLAKALKLHEGDPFLAYFIGDKVKARRFTVHNVYEGMPEAGDSPVVYVPISDLRRLNGWSENSTGVLEVTVADRSASRAELKELAAELSNVIYTGRGEDDVHLIATASSEKYSQLFDWLDLIDFNVAVLLILMIIVAGVNMISGLLIMLFRNIATIGQLKTLGMTDRGIAKVFISLASRAVLKGMLAGNAAALLFCVIQKYTGLIGLNPANYFVDHVPVEIDPAMIISIDIVAYTAICLLLCIPALFIARVDPAETVKTA